jgi:hypothetical protein
MPCPVCHRTETIPLDILSHKKYSFYCVNLCPTYHIHEVKPTKPGNMSTIIYHISQKSPSECDIPLTENHYTTVTTETCCGCVIV